MDGSPATLAMGDERWAVSDKRYVKLYRWLPVLGINGSISTYGRWLSRSAFSFSVGILLLGQPDIPLPSALVFMATPQPLSLALRSAGCIILRHALPRPSTPVISDIVVLRIRPCKCVAIIQGVVDIGAISGGTRMRRIVRDDVDQILFGVTWWQGEKKGEVSRLVTVCREEGP